MKPQGEPRCVRDSRKLCAHADGFPTAITHAAVAHPLGRMVTYGWRKHTLARSTAREQDPALVVQHMAPDTRAPFNRFATRSMGIYRPAYAACGRGLPVGCTSGEPEGLIANLAGRAHTVIDGQRSTRRCIAARPPLPPFQWRPDPLPFHRTADVCRNACRAAYLAARRRLVLANG